MRGTDSGPQNLGVLSELGRVRHEPTAVPLWAAVPWRPFFVPTPCSPSTLFLSLPTLWLSCLKIHPEEEWAEKEVLKGKKEWFA